MAATASHTTLAQSRSSPMMPKEKRRYAFHGSAYGERHQDPRGARLERRARAPLHGLVMLAKTAHFSQPQRHSVAIAPYRSHGQRKHAAVVSRHQSARAGAGAGA